MDWQKQVTRWAENPLDFVLEALFQLDRESWRPWVPGTPRPDRSPPGPEHWQGLLLEEVADARVNGRRRFTVRAGHGVGKTTVEAWIIIWALLFLRPCKVPITANSQDQLRDVVWTEVALWHRKLPPFLKDMIDVQAETIRIRHDPEAAFAVARTARPEKPEALQGFHSDNLVFVIEEASGIDDVIFQVASGALSSEDSWVFMFANPTRTSGYFYNSHNGPGRHQWRRFHVPCSNSSRVKPSYAEEIARDYGEQSNVFKVRVLGEFPISEDNAVIALGLVEAAIDRPVSPSDVGVVWGLDVARFGDDTTCLAKRRGNVLLEPTMEWRKTDLMQSVGRIVREYHETPLGARPGAINVDVIGLGAGVVDRLKELGLPVRGINVGESPATDDGRFMRLRDELWWRAREWFTSLDCTIPRDEHLIDELVGPTYKYESTGKIRVESKDDMKKRGIKSPNRADAFCLTLAGGDLVGAVYRPETSIAAYDPFEVNSDRFEQHVRGMSRHRQAVSGDGYDPFA
jgi:hypothetical protein